MVQVESAASSDRGTGNKTVLHGKYELGRLLGHGTFAKVFMARDVRSNGNLAVKVVGKEKVIKAGMMEQVQREISVMKMVKHPNIVQLHEVMASKSKIYLAMELVRGGELFSKIACKGRLQEDGARNYFRQLVSAVDFCHSRGVYHRDLKPENLLVDEDGNLKIADFGLSALVDHNRADGLLHTTCGTPSYIAPEVIKKKGYDGAKADLWSCGVILYVLLAGRLPFHDENLGNLYKKIFKGEFKFPPWLSSDARRLIRRLLDPNPRTRITVSKLVEMPWFKAASPDEQATGGGEKMQDQPCLISRWGKEKPDVLNAFHIISLSEGFDLSPLFEEGREEEMRFATREPASGVVSRLEGVAAKAERRFLVRKGELSVRLEGVERGRKGKLAVVAEIFPLAPEVSVVEVKRDGGDTSEYARFCSDELRPALEDIIICPSPQSQQTPTPVTTV